MKKTPEQLFQEYEEVPSTPREGRQNEGRDHSIEGEFADAVADCTSFEQLYDVVRNIGDVAGSKRYFDAEEIIGLIETARGAPVAIVLNRITRTAGLRDKVRELLQSEHASFEEEE